MADNLKNPPLVEAIFELRWKLTPLGTPASKGGNGSVPVHDPNYKFLVGTIYNSIREKYPISESLPTASLPEELVAYIPQYRFRVQKDSWPLIQLGAGLLSYNSTRDYKWEKFLNDSNDIVEKFCAAYSMSPDKTTPLKIERLVLQYINAFPFKFQEKNSLDFLEKELNFTIKPMPELFDKDNIAITPVGFSNSIGFQVENPKGRITFNHGTGNRDNSPVILWNIELSSQADDVPLTPEKFKEWIVSAHEVIEACFFKSLSPGLKESFKGI